MSGKRLRKQELEKRMVADQEAFISEVKKMAQQSRFPWTDVDLRNKGDELSELDTWIKPSFTHESERSTSILIDRSPASAATGGIEWLEQKSCALCYHHELVHVLSPVVGDLRRIPISVQSAW